MADMKETMRLDAAQTQGAAGMHHAAASGMDMADMGGMVHSMNMADLRRRFWICLVLAVPVVLLAPMGGMAIPFRFSFPGSGWVVLGLATVLYFYGGYPFLRGAVGEVRAGRPAMMTLIALGLTAAYAYSVYAFFANLAGTQAQGFFTELATLTAVMLLGHWVEMRALASASSSLQGLAALLPATATVVDANGTKDIPLRQLRTGQTVLVQPGARIPADGLVSEGESGVDESLVTGEARSVTKRAGDRVIGGAQNGGGRLQIKVTGTGESGYVSRVAGLVRAAQEQKSRAETLSDRVAGWLFYVALAIALLALVAWLVLGSGLGVAVARAVTVLVIACPHALGLAVPLVTARATAIGAKHGLLVKNRQALESAPDTDLLVMDKTGTLTQGRFRVNYIESFDAAHSENDILAIAAGLEQGSGHPLAAGILQKAQERGVTPLRATDVQGHPGSGVSGRTVGGEAARLVSAGTLESEHILYNSGRFKQLSGRGYSVSYLVLGGKPVGLIAQGDSIKQGAKELVQYLGRRRIRPVMLTGDNPRAARNVAAQLGIDEYRANLLPQDKQQVIKSYQAAGRRVMMVGDGINDAPALAAADVGVAIGAGTDVAIGSADAVLVRSEPEDIESLLALSKRTRRKMRQNLFWGAGYNAVALPLAAGVLAPWGITLAPAVGSLLMALSTVIVAVNALALHLPREEA